MAEQNRVIKKGSELNFIKKIYNYFGFLLPIFYILFFLSLIYVGINYYLLNLKENKLKEVNQSYFEALTLNKGIINLLGNYNKVLVKYNEYLDVDINYNTLFFTLQKYIPSKMLRSNINIELKNNSILTVSINGKIEGYDDFISLLKLVDKCNFTDEKMKKDFLSLTKVELSADGEKLSQTKNVSLNFMFDTKKNKILNNSYYKEINKKINQYGNYLYLFQIINGNTEDLWNEKGIDYKKYVKDIIDKKNNFSKKLLSLSKLDSNGYYIGGSAGNFITEYRDENKIFIFLIDYLQKEKNKILSIKDNIFDEGIVKYKKRKDEKEKFIINIKKELDEKILKIDKEISYLTLLIRYNEYLLNNNQLNTFENIRIKKGAESEKIIAKIINDAKILEENDSVLNPFLGNFKTEKEKSEKIKQAYVTMFNFIKEADKNKKNYLDVKNKYIDNYYKDYYYNNGISIFYTILKEFIDNNYDESLFSKLTYKNYNFNAENVNANFSYKKRFYLTLKNDFNTRNFLSFISNENEFSKALNTYEDFILQENDLITYNNSKINCLTRDIKGEIKNIYSDILSEQSIKTENYKKMKELDIIINTLK